MVLSQFREDQVFKSLGAGGVVSAIFPPISHESSFSLETENMLLVCVPSCDAASACRDSLHPSPAEPAVLDKICYLGDITTLKQHHQSY